jgi:hypothetical protein
LLISEFFVFRPRRGLQRAQAQGVEPRGAEQMDQVSNSPPPPDPCRSNLLIPPRVLQIISILSCVRASVWSTEII